MQDSKIYMVSIIITIASLFVDVFGVVIHAEMKEKETETKRDMVDSKIYMVSILNTVSLSPFKS